MYYDIDKLPWEDFHMGRAARNTLIRSGYATIASIAPLDYSALLEIRLIGHSKAITIQNVLTAYKRTNQLVEAPQSHDILAVLTAIHEELKAIRNLLEKANGK